MSELMAKEWAEWLEREKSNVETLESKLENLSSNHGGPGGFQYQEFWAEANELAELFDSLTPLPQQDKDRLWDQYLRICDEVKKREAKQLEARKSQSTQKRQLIEQKIAEAASVAESAPDDIQTLSQAQSYLKEALSLLKGKPDDQSASADDEASSPHTWALMRRDRQVCWDKWREVNDTIHSRRQAIWDSNYEQIEKDAKAALEEANGRNPYEALEMVKAAQSRLKEIALSKTQRDEMKTLLSQAWDTAIGRVNEIREKRRKKQEEWLNQKQNEVQELANQLRENEETHSKLQDEVEKLKEAIHGSRSKEYGDKLRTQIAEKRRKIRDIERENRQLEERIEEAKNKLGQQTADQNSVQNSEGSTQES
ncbi:MAG: hypothetical protein ACLFVK_04480 [Dehalococcoidia bacterium]